MIGPITTMASFQRTFGSLTPTMHGVIVSSVLLTGALAALVAGILADRHGRTKIMALGSFIYGVGTAIECGSTILGLFIFGRLVQGIGTGLFLSAVFVQISETSPARIRGIMTSVPQFGIEIGIAAGYFICYGTSRIGDETSSLSWRLPMGLASLLAFAFCATTFLIPPSPRWLLAQGRVDEARGIVAQLGLGEEERRELLEQSAGGLAHSSDLTFAASVRAMFSEFHEAFTAPFRGRTAFGCFIAGMQQFSGIDGVLYYAPILFAQAGLSSEQAGFLASGVSALVMVAAGVPATLFADHWGRRTSSLVGGGMITFLMLLMGSLYASGEVHADSGAGRWVVIVCIYLFGVVFVATWAIGFKSWIVESLPQKTRSSASSLAQSANWVCLWFPALMRNMSLTYSLQTANFIVALTTPALIAKSVFGAYYFFAGCTLFCTVFIALFMQETRGQSLEAIEQTFMENSSRATGRWNVHGFRLRRIRVAQSA
jgi:sugar porter (SP) family MFS transporter